MDKKTAPLPDDNTTGMKIARWAVWGAVSVLMLWAVTQLPVFHLAGQ